MKTRIPKTILFMGIFAALIHPSEAQTKMSDRAPLSAAALDPGTDILGIVDISAGAAGSKKITIDNLFLGWGVTPAGKTFLGATSAAAQRAALGLGSAAVQPFSSFEGNLQNPATDGYVLSSTAAGIRSWVAQSSGGGGGAGALLAANNLSELMSPATARNNLGLGTAATNAATFFEANLGIPGGSSNKFLISTPDGVRSWATQSVYEQPLGNPSADGYLLSSTAAGVRSWVAPPSSGGGGGGTTPSFPLVASFTSGWHNQGTRTATDTSNGLWFYGPSVQSGLNLGLLLKPITTTNWTVVVDMEIFMKMAPYQSIGLATMESSTGKIIAYNLQADSRHMRVLWPSANSGAPSDAGASSLSSVNYGNIKYDLIMKIECGSSIKWSVSYTRGATWQVIANNPVNDFITPDRVGLFMNNYITDDVGMLVKSFVGP